MTAPRFRSPRRRARGLLATPISWRAFGFFHAQARIGQQGAASATHPQHVDLRFGDAAGAFKTRRIGVPPGDDQRQSFDLRAESRIHGYGDGETVTEAHSQRRALFPPAFWGPALRRALRRLARVRAEGLMRRRPPALAPRFL